LPIRKADIFKPWTTKRRDVKALCDVIDTISEISSPLICAISENGIDLETTPTSRLRWLLTVLSSISEGHQEYQPPSTGSDQSKKLHPI
jgi:hypothetical protein